MPMGFSETKGMSQQLIKLFSLVLIFFYVVCYSSPEDPIKCSSGNRNCTIKNAFGAFPDRSICRAAEALYPTTQEELISMVASAARIRRKIKVKKGDRQKLVPRNIYSSLCNFFYFNFMH